MIAGDNFIIFRTDKLFEDKVKIKGRELYFDPSFEPWLHVRTYGEVIQIPLRLGSIPIMQEAVGVPHYVDQSPYRYKFLSDIPREVQPGDRIYFHFNTIIKMKQNLLYEKKDKLGTPIEWWFKVRYDQVLCAVRAGQIIPIGSYVLVEPDMESLDEILIPIAVTGADGKPLKDEGGRAIMKPKEQWLQVKEKPSAKYMRGWVRHIGTPLDGDPEPLYKPGQLIYFRPNADWTNVIEGTKYYTIRQKHIVGRVEND